MQDQFDPFAQDERKRRRKPTFLLEVDSWIDSTLYESRFAAAEFWEEVVIFFRRFRVYGFNRSIFEVLSEGMTLTVAGAVIMLALALPAADEVSSNWRDQDEFAVTFLDRYGNEIGQRGILHTEAVDIGDLPD
ncbi:MAG: penicillin-binding protein, partial [Pseudomonadota bacterium]